jgi:hypothetical protein
VIHPDCRTDLRASRLVVIAICVLLPGWPLLLLEALPLESVATSCKIEDLPDRQPSPAGAEKRRGTTCPAGQTPLYVRALWPNRIAWVQLGTLSAQP